MKRNRLPKFDKHARSYRDADERYFQQMINELETGRSRRNRQAVEFITDVRNMSEDSEAMG